MRLFLLTALFLVSLTAAASGSSTVERKPLAIAAITTQQAQIREDVINRNGRYKDMPASTRVDLLAKQAGLLRILEGKTSTDDLSETQRVEAFNTLEWIEAAINNAEDERMVCRREKTIGSTRLVRVCRTVEEERRMKETARQRFDDGNVMGGR